MMILQHQNNINYLTQAYDLVRQVMLQAKISDPSDDVNDLAVALDSLEGVIFRNFYTRN